MRKNCPVQGSGLLRLFKLHVLKLSSLFHLIVFSSPPPPILCINASSDGLFMLKLCIDEGFMFVLFVQVFIFYYGLFCDCLASGQIILSLKIKKLLLCKHLRIQYINL